MRYFVLLLLSICPLSEMVAQAGIQSREVGDTLIITQPNSKVFRHIKFPRRNFIIKRGGIANYKTVVGRKVRIIEKKMGNDGSVVVRLERIDGKPFFRKFPTVSANLEKATEAGELARLSAKKED